MPDQLTIIMLGALSEQISEEQLQQRGIQGFLVKPVDPHELMDVLNSPLNGHTADSTPADTPTASTAVQVTRRVLMAEDTPINQTLQTILLNRMGYEVTIANNGLEAVEAFNSGNFDLVLMDVQMPEMGGVEATQEIRQRESLRTQPDGTRARIPIIAVTANALKGDREHYIASGMDGYVSKPISVEALKSEMARVMAGKADN